MPRAQSRAAAAAQRRACARRGRPAGCPPPPPARSLAKSTDGGLTWAQLPSPVSATGAPALRSLCSPDGGQTVWAMGSYNWTLSGGGDNRTVGIYTADGGASWQPLAMVRLRQLGGSGVGMLAGSGSARAASRVSQRAAAAAGSRLLAPQGPATVRAALNCCLLVPPCPVRYRQPDNQYGYEVRNGGIVCAGAPGQPPFALAGNTKTTPPYSRLYTSTDGAHTGLTCLLLLARTSAAQRGGAHACPDAAPAAGEACTHAAMRAARAPAAWRLTKARLPTRLRCLTCLPACPLARLLQASRLWKIQRTPLALLLPGRTTS